MCVLKKEKNEFVPLKIVDVYKCLVGIKVRLLHFKRAHGIPINHLVIITMEIAVLVSVFGSTNTFRVLIHSSTKDWWLLSRSFCMNKKLMRPSFFYPPPKKKF